MNERASFFSEIFPINKNKEKNYPKGSLINIDRTETDLILIVSF